jgi:tellurite methyltransferase
MSREDRVIWDKRRRAGEHSDTAPDPFLLHLEAYWELLPETGRALDLACGTGRNAVWLAEKGSQTGWSVVGYDISLEGLRMAKALSGERGVRLDLVCMDLETPPPCQEYFELILCFSYLERKLFPWIKAALRRGGLVVYKTYTVEGKRLAGGPHNERFLLQPQELLDAFRDFRVLFYEEKVKDRGVAQLIAQKI